MPQAEVLLSWIRRVISFDIEDKILYSKRCKVFIGNLPPYSFVLDKDYNPITRTLTCCVPQKYHDFIYPSEEEKKAALLYRVYYSIQR